MLDIIATAILAFAAGFAFAEPLRENEYDKGWQDCWNTFKGFANETEEAEEDV